MDTSITHSPDARAVAGITDTSTDPDPEVPERARGPRRYSAKYKVEILAEYEGLSKADKGALLRQIASKSNRRLSWFGAQWISLPRPLRASSPNGSRFSRRRSEAERVGCRAC